MPLLPVHIVAGVTALVAGFLAIFVLKGGWLHRRSGKVFVVAMLVLGISGAVLATIKFNRGNLMGGALAVYFVTTALLTIRRPAAGSDWKDFAAMLIGLGVGITGLVFGFEALRSPTGRTDGYPPPFYFIFASIALLSASGDIRMMRARGIAGMPRIRRHLWRMCMAMFMATGSFFFGQAQVIPEPIRIMPLLAIPALLPLVLMIYWVSRVWITKRYSSRAASVAG